MPPSFQRHSRRLVRLLWLATVGIVVGLFVRGIPLYFSQMQQPCVPGDCLYLQLPAESAHALLSHFGLSLESYAGYLTSLMVVSLVAFLSCAAIIFWQKPHSKIATFVSFGLVLSGTTFFFTVPDAVVQVYPAWRLPINLLHATGLWLMITFGYVFPDGHFVPAWTRYVALLAALLFPTVFMFTTMQAIVDPATVGGDLLGLLLVGWIMGAAGAQLYRYRYAAGPIERQQLKWVAFGFATFALVVGAFTVVLLFLPQASVPGLFNGLYYLVGGTLIVIALLLFVLSFGLAILRYRLWDIDVLVNRALLYSALTGSLLLVYFTTVVLLQQLFRVLTGQSSNTAIIASTLAIAALFNPLRHRIQAFIDSRFYRRKYDAQQTLAAFATTVRNEVELERLTGELLRVIDETMQPEHVSLWLRDVTKESKEPS